ncbi:MAG TPA: condensation domain-containing protein, partial [Pyrinomonadaceae bacterium]
MSSLVIESPDIVSGVAGHSLTLIELLEWRARTQPERVAYTYLVDGEAITNRLTWGELHQRARIIARQLTALGATGKTVLLLYPSDLEYVAAFFGCLQAGAIAVPAYPPRMNRTLDRLQAIVADSHAAFALTISAIGDRIKPMCDRLPYLNSLRWLNTDDLTQDVTDVWHYPELSGDTPAFLQYTSGSTSQPKGVMVSHGNLLHNEQLIQQAFAQTESSIIVGWLPLYHDMGLIGNVLQTLYVGARCILMSPPAFLQSPVRWLQAISSFGATTSGGPNFAYDLCVRKVTDEQRAQLDLSTWKVAFNGAEPIRPETLKRFAKTFAPCGFKAEALHPCYGLAEATLFVSGKTCGTQPRVSSFNSVELVSNRAVNSNGNGAEGRSLVSCGVPTDEQKVRIVNTETLTECAPGEVGEIWISGQSVAGGYWNQPEATAFTFGAQLADDAKDKFLRTGDLGFLHEGELYVTGRLKDLIIIRGLNHYPQDIEQTAEQSHAALRAGCGAAFSLEVEGEERLVIVHEVQRNCSAAHQEIIDAIRQRVSEEHEVQVYAISLIRHGTMSKTSSGKIQRNACRLAFVNGGLSLEAEWREASETSAVKAAATVDTAQSPEAWLQTAVARLLRVDPKQIDVDQPITRYGLDSLMAAELLHAIEERFGITIPLSTLLESVSVSQLCERFREVSVRTEQRHDASESDSSSTARPLSSNQQSLWFLHQLAPHEPTYNLAFAARVQGSLDANGLRNAFQSLVDRHASLRTTFAAGDGEPVQQIIEQATAYFEEHDGSQWDQAQLDQALVNEAQRAFDLEHGPLLKVHLYERAPSDWILLLTTHHIIVDLWSLTVLIHELGILYSAQQSGVTADLPPVTYQYLAYARWQNGLLRSELGESHRQYWTEQLAGPLPMSSLSTDRPRPPVQTYHGAAHSFSLTPQLTRRLKSLSRENNATLYMTLLAAFDVLLYRYTGQEDILVGSPTSGRTRNWMAGMIGYLVNPVVMRASVSSDESFAKFLE